MKKQVYISIISLICCFLVFASTAFAWFTLQDENESEGTEFNIHDVDLSISMDYWNGTTWVETNEIALNQFNPGDVKYFRINITNNSNEDVDLRTRIESYSSSASSELFYDEDTNMVYVVDNMDNQIEMYEADDNQMVYVNNKVLYNCNYGIQLKDYLIENRINVHFVSLGSKNITFVPTSLTNPKTLNESISTFALNAFGEVSMIFALSFNSNSDDNYYQYQTFRINSILISIE